MKKILISIILILTGYNFSAQGIEDLSFGTDTTFEAMTWNIEWFPKNGQITIDYVKQIIDALDVDLLALQEISDTILFRQMVESIDGYETYFESAWYGGLAYIYKTDVIEIQDIYEIFYTSPYWSAFPRSPMVMEMSFNNENFIIINNHFKCCGDGILDLNDPNDEETRRFYACNFLKQYIDTDLQNEKVIVLGDLNDILTDDPANNVFQNILNDTDNYLFADMEIAEGSNSGWSYPSWPSHIDHILLTNDLFDEFDNDGSDIQTIKIDEYMEGGFNAYDENISDHRPVALKIKTDLSAGIINKNTIEFILFNYPNPFKLITYIYSKPIQENKEIEIYNINGKKIQTLIILKGQTSIIWNAESFPAGIYFAKQISDKKEISFTKMVLIK